jgi:hypothetical protein
MANLIVSTTSNNEAMNRAVRGIADECLSGRPVITEGLLNNIEVGIRAYDPCLSCATQPRPDAARSDVGRFRRNRNRSHGEAGVAPRPGPRLGHPGRRTTAPGFRRGPRRWAA